MNKLLRIGFEACGHWRIQEGRLVCDLTRFATQNNILYAFTVDGELVYIGKTVQPLAARMAGYRNPAPSQTTNVRNNARILEKLQQGCAVEIFALPDTGLHRYGDFHLNLAAALEDDIVRVMRPPWNGGKKEQVEPQIGQASDSVQLPVLKTFEVVLGRTYFAKGFFNVPVAQQECFASDGERIEIYLGDRARPVLGTVNRTANANQAPRIMGGVDVRDWFREAGQEGATLLVDVLSRNAVRLRVL